MKRFMSPAFFAVVVVSFFLPFVSISCNASAFQEGLGGIGEGVEGVEDPFGGGIPGVPGGGGEVEIAKGTGLDIVLGTSVEPEGFGGLGDLGQAEQTEEGSWGDLDGRLFVVLALAAAVLGLGLSLLRGRAGGSFAVLMGIAGVALLVMFRAVASPDFGEAAQVGLGADAVSLDFKMGWWLASAGFVLAAASGLWVAMTGAGRPQEAEVAASPPAEPPPPSDEPPPTE